MVFLAFNSSHNPPALDPTLDRLAVLYHLVVASYEHFYLLWIVYTTHTYYLCPSTTLSFYLVCSVSRQATISWTALQNDGLSFTFNSVGCTCVYLCLLVLHETPKWHIVAEDIRNHAGRESAYGFFGRIFALWLIPTVRRGYKVALNTSDFDGLAPELLTNQIMQRFERVWFKCKLQRRYCSQLRSSC